MKVLLLSHIFPPAVDGGSRVIYKLGQYFESQNHETLYLSSNCSSTDDFVKSKNKVALSREMSRDSRDRGFLKIPVYHHLRRPLKLINLFIPKQTYLHQLFEVFQKGPIFKIIPIIKAIIKIANFKPDLIVAGPFPTTIILYAQFLKKIFKTKLLINASFHQTDPDFLKKPLIKTLRKSDYIWTLTQYEKTFFETKLKIQPNKIILAGNGVDQDLLINDSKIHFPKNPNLLFIGSLSAHKKVDLLINAFVSLSSKEEMKNSTLTIAGQKTLFYPQLKNQIKLLDPKIKSKIKFCFNFPQKKLIKLIDSATILVLPSIQESFGLVLIESWSRGKPVITSDIPPLKELVKKTNGGLYFESNSAKDLEQKISTLIKNPNSCQKLGQNGLEYVKNNYTWNKVGEKICQKILY